MANTLRIHIIITFIIACACVALIVASFSTQLWIEGQIKLTSSSLSWTNDINYGLFSGHISGTRGFSVKGELTMSCDMSANVCIMSCQTTEELRAQELHNVTNNGMWTGCPFSRAEIDTCDGKCTEFIDAGMWVSSVLFLSLGLLGSVLAAVFAVVNSTVSPIEPILSVPGLYIWNGASALCTLVVLILWGTLYLNTLQDNIAYSETMTGLYSSEASLSVSYWLLLVALFLEIGNICVLVLRKYQLAHEPPPPTVKMDENTDGIIFLY
ncbi:hypothetical protein L9F63_005945 [Diploptera punctata]|uniref:Uncharacterized protein n=1 Tax=Diploptera punctata TaxID=6984 RepID=A0AAD7ZB62_DIPPU|nr:hypothetical protein L9F63_005945 [Diploptera punctata]